MRNMARHLTDGFDRFLLGKRYLVLDRDRLFSRAFREILRGSGVEPLRCNCQRCRVWTRSRGSPMMLATSNGDGVSSTGDHAEA